MTIEHNILRRTRIVLAFRLELERLARENRTITSTVLHASRFENVKTRAKKKNAFLKLYFEFEIIGRSQLDWKFEKRCLSYIKIKIRKILLVKVYFPSQFFSLLSFGYK